jgi:ribosomal protein S14
MINSNPTKNKKEISEDDKDILRVLSNAFDFLEEAISQFEASPKYSVINFCSGIELILKARLMIEHWSLIVDGSPNLQKFKSGAAKTLNFTELIPRIKDVTKDKIDDNIKNCFKRLADHRNRMIHFYHKAQTGTKEAEDEKTTIAIEQATAWYCLQKIIEQWIKNEKCETIFKKCERGIAFLNTKMLEHNKYLQVVYENIKKEIENDQKKGIEYITCSSCSYPTGKEIKLASNIYGHKCKICSYLDPVKSVKINCPDCNNFITLTESEIRKPTIQCISCGIQIDTESIKESLDTDPATKDNYYDRVQANCPECSSYHSVIRHDDYFLCTNCLNISEEIEYCEWCGEAQLGGELGDSFYDGCLFCDGRRGEPDDD